MQAETSNERDTGALRVAAPAISRVMQRQKLYTLSALLIISAVFSIGVWSWVVFYKAAGSPVGLFTQTDYPAITIASRLVSEGYGSQLYSLDAQLEGQRRLISEGYIALSPGASLQYPYPYTPVIAVLMSPFAGLAPTTNMAIWDILNIVSFAWGLWFLLSTLSLPRFTRLLLLLGALTSLPFIVNLEQGQSSGIVMLGFGLGIGLLKKGRDLPAGLAFGLLLLKIQWLPILLLVLLWKRRWRTLAGIAAMGGALTLASVAAAGTGWLPDYLHILGRAQQYARELLLDPWYSHSFPGGLTALIGRGADDVVHLANFAVEVSLVALLLFLWRGKWDPSNRRWSGLVAASLLTISFTNLQLNTHDLSLLALPGALGLAYLTGQLKSRRLEAAWIFTLWTLYLATGLFLPQVFSLPVRISTLAIGLLLTLLVYALLRKSPDHNIAGSIQSQEKGLTGHSLSGDLGGVSQLPLFLTPLSPRRWVKGPTTLHRPCDIPTKLSHPQELVI